MRLRFLLVLALALVPASAARPAGEIEVGIAGPVEPPGPGLAPAPGATFSDPDTSPDAAADASPQDPLRSPEPGSGAVLPREEEPLQPRVFEPRGRRFEVLEGTLKLRAHHHAGDVRRAIEIAFVSGDDGAVERVEADGRAVDLVYNADFLEALLTALEDAASDLLHHDAGVGLLGVPRAVVRASGASTRLRIAGSVEIDTGDRVREGDFVFKSSSPTSFALRDDPAAN